MIIHTVLILESPRVVGDLEVSELTNRFQWIVRKFESHCQESDVLLSLIQATRMYLLSPFARSSEP